MSRVVHSACAAFARRTSLAGRASLFGGASAPRLAGARRGEAGIPAAVLACEAGQGRGWLALGAAGAALLGTAACAAGDGPLSGVRGSAAFRALTDSVGVPLMRLVFDAEDAHIWTIRSLRCGLGPRESAALETSEEAQRLLSTRVFGLDFRNPVGLAAGFDKQAEVMGEILEMGFGFLEVGGVTPEPQPGNPRPRCFRLLEDQAVINRYGLNSEGHAAVVPRLEEFTAKRAAAIAGAAPGGGTADASGLAGVPTRYAGQVGVNLAKNTAQPNAEADYRAGVRALGDGVQFLVVNVSCPNVSWTKGLGASAIGGLVNAVREERDLLLKRRAGAAARAPLPVLLKIGPDSSDDELKGYVQLAFDTKADGLVVANTSSQRPESLTSALKAETGGLSGAPLKTRNLEVLRKVYEFSGGKLPLVGVGGIANGQDAYDRIRAGASLIEIYTAMVYEGPGVVSRIKRELMELLKRDGFASIGDAVGADHRAGRK